VSAKANKSLIGAFVLGAMALAVGAVAAFGSGMFFTKKYKFVMYFENSVNGLAIGSQVLFRGVPIGLVTGIGVDADASRLHFYIPVTIELESGKISVTTKNGKRPGKDETLMEARNEPPETILKELVDKGLRAQLVTQSFVTGQQAVSLDFFPGKAVRLVGPAGTPEIPTVPSEFEEFSQTLKTLPLQELAHRLVGAVAGVERLVNSPEITRLPVRLDKAIKHGTELFTAVEEKVDPLYKEIEDTLRAYNALAKNVDGRADKLSASAEKSIESLTAALKEARTVIGKVERVVSPDSPTVTDLNKALAEVAQAAKSLRALADYLERHPEALVQGKGNYRR
jgi:paraquat-inducible protein B